MAKDPPLKPFGEHLAELRVEAELTVEQCAEALDMKPIEWETMEAQSIYPKLRMFRPIANLLGINPEELL